MLQVSAGSKSDSCGNGRETGPYHLPARIRRIRRFDLLVDPSYGVHREWEVRV